MRRSPTDRKATLLQKKAEIEKQLAGLEARERAAERKRDTRRKIIIGAAVLAHAEIDSSFAAKLQEVLSRAVTRPADRAAVADQLGN